MNNPSSSSPPKAIFERRFVLTAGLASAAVLAGVGVSVWQSKRKQELGQPPESLAKPITGGLDELWQMQFDTPDSGKLAMQSQKGRPLLINFWATWCPPCVEELPLLERFYSLNKAKSAQIVGLAADKPDAVRAFLKKLPLTFPIGITDLSGIALSKSWGNLAGGLPFSVMLAADGHVMQRKMGKLNEDDLKIWLAAAQ